MTSRQRVPAVFPTDAALVERIVSGDLQSLGVLFDRYEADVSRMLRRMGVEAADVDDLVQTTFVQLIIAAPGFDARFSVRSWVLGVAAMMLRRHRRTVGRMAERVASWATSIVRTEPTTPAEAWDSEESARRMQAALTRLSPKRREAFVLVTLEGATGEEAAAALCIPLNTLWTRLHHARRDLRAWLIEEGQ